MARTKNKPANNPAVENDQTKQSPEAEPSNPNPVSTESGGPTGFVQRAGAEPAKIIKDRLSFPVTADGRLDADSLKGKNRERVREFLSNPDNFAALGIAAQPQGEESLFKFTEKDAESALNFMNGTNAWATAFVLKRFKGFEIHPQVLERAYVIPEDRKKELTERGARLMNRYSSEWMRRHADLVFFVLGYIDVVKMQAFTAVTMQAQINQAQAAAQAGQHPGPRPGVAGANGAEAAEHTQMV